MATHSETEAEMVDDPDMKWIQYTDDTGNPVRIPVVDYEGR